MDILLTVLSGIAIAAVSSWITVQLSKRQFQSQRWWERKVETYERIIEAFHDLKKFSSEYMAAEERKSDISKERYKELSRLANKARDEILKAADKGSFILSWEAENILSRYEAESENMPRQNTRYEHLDLSWSIAHRYMVLLKNEAKKDLKR